MKFRAGQSGNPGGRPKVEGEIRDLARAHGPAAIERLAELMRSSNERVAVAACQALLDRGFGKPAQAIQHAFTEDVPTPSFGIYFTDGGPGVPRQECSNDETTAEE